VSERPGIVAGVAAALLATAPGRVRTRLDADPGMAERWAWERDPGGWVVRAGAETVRIEPDAGTVAQAGQLACSCLLAPRCLHLLAVASALEPVEGGGTGSAQGPPPPPAPGPGEPATPPPAPVELSTRQRAAATLAWGAGTRLLATGAGAAGTTARGDLLRAAHACHEAGLYRPGAAAIRVATGVRDLATERPEFELAALAEDLAELLTVAWRLGSADGAASTADLGVGRRRYRPVGGLRLHGLASEAVVTASGYAGVVTWLVDQAGRVWTLPDIAPGEPARAPEAYRTAVRFGRLALRHRELGRSQVLAQGAAGSADGRLGSGGDVSATTAGPSSWDATPLAACWTDPLEEQLDRAWRAQELPVGERPAGADLLFLEAVVLAVVPGGLAFEARNARRPLQLHGVAASEHAELAYLDNLRRLGELAGQPLRLVGRVRLDRPRAVTLLAAGGPALRLPDAMGGRANLGLDRLTGGHVRATAAAATLAGGERPPTPPGQDTPLRGLRRVLLRAALGGRATLGAAAVQALEAEAHRLRRAQLPTGADLLEGLAAAGVETRRTLTGEHAPPPPDRLARAWTATALYLAAADRSLLRAAWEA
jgi:SWIM zinc finger